MPELLPWHNKHIVKPVVAEKRHEPVVLRESPGVIYYSYISNAVSITTLYESDCPGIREYVLRSVTDAQEEQLHQLIRNAHDEIAMRDKEIEQLKTHIKMKEETANRQTFPGCRAWKKA